MKSNKLFILIGCCFFLVNTLQAQSSNDRCLTAVLIESTTTCQERYNEGTEFTGPQNSCTLDSVGSLWFKYYMTQSGKLKIKTQQDFYLGQTNFNDVVTLFRNSCSNLQPIDCYNNDKFGFIGETVYTDQLNGGDTLWIRVSGSQDMFGKCSGKVCIEVEVVGMNEGLPPPEDNCSTAGNLTVNQPCINGTTINATSDWAIPTDFPNSSHCVWYTFTPTVASEYSINTHADFSDIITLWTGNCSNPVELVSSDGGQNLMTPLLVAGQTYYVQLCGAFSSLQGDFCLEVIDSRPVDVNLSAFMEGPWDGVGQMSTLLWQFDILPAGQPYNNPPWNYTGQEGAGWTMSDYPMNTVDWVLVSLRASATNSDAIDQAAGILLEDGTVQLLSPMQVSQGYSEVYVVIEHRNHLPIMSPAKVPIINGTLSYNFTLNNSYQGGASGQKPLNGVWMMFAGNVDQTNLAGYEITGADRIIWGVETGNFNQYLGSDFNLDRDVNGADRIYWEGNNGTFSAVPK